MSISYWPVRTWSAMVSNSAISLVAPLSRQFSPDFEIVLLSVPLAAECHHPIKKKAKTGTDLVNPFKFLLLCLFPAFYHILTRFLSQYNWSSNRTM